jgi:hypothetical protein
MPTLADALRQTGYVQNDQPVAQPSTGLAEMLRQHIASIPQKFEENQQNQMDLLQKAFPGNTYESMMTQGDPKAMAELAMQVPFTGMTASYKGSHTAPNAKEYGAYFHALDELMPKDVYSLQGKRLYGIGDTLIDHDWYMAALKSKGKPEAMVEVHRAVPKGVKDINNGDWVTPSKKYAEWHGENALNGDYDILTKKVKAKELSSEGYPYELGYNPE